MCVTTNRPKDMKTLDTGLLCRRRDGGRVGHPPAPPPPPPNRPAVIAAIIAGRYAWM